MARVDGRDCWPELMGQGRAQNGARPSAARKRFLMKGPSRGGRARGGSSWAISSNANKELAADFLGSTFAGSTEFYDKILPSSGAIANWLPAGESKVYAEPQEFFGGQAVFADVLKFAKNVPANNTGVYYYEARDAVAAAITKVIAGTDVNTALEEAQKTVEFAMQ